uniref:PB1 domain-containing protein n=1 Tax=Globodera pallida TaxID=36090 RepID=A0A183BTM2_GLOPA
MRVHSHFPPKSPKHQQLNQQFANSFNKLQADASRQQLSIAGRNQQQNGHRIHITWNHFGQKAKFHLDPNDPDLFEALHRSVRGELPNFRGNLAFKDYDKREVLIRCDRQIREAAASRGGNRLHIYTTLSATPSHHLAASELGTLSGSRPSSRGGEDDSALMRRRIFCNEQGKPYGGEAMMKKNGDNKAALLNREQHKRCPWHIRFGPLALCRYSSVAVGLAPTNLFMAEAAGAGGGRFHRGRIGILWLEAEDRHGEVVHYRLYCQVGSENK